MRAWLHRLDASTRTWWFGDVSVLVLSLGVMLVAALMVPSHEMLSLFGVEIPVTCSFRALTGSPCLGCGLTRSFTFMAHGMVWDAFMVNKLGPPGFLVVLAQVPWRGFKLWRHQRQPGVVPSSM